MSLKGARVLLTGGTGFIGSRVAAALAAAGAKTSFLVRASSKADGLSGPKLVGSLTDPASLAAAVKASDPEYVLHLAKDREARGFEPQVRATTMLAAALAGAKSLKRWVRTAHAGGARGADEQLAKTLSEKFSLPVTTLELFLVYGPGQRPGDFPRDLVDAALAGKTVAAPAGEKDLVYVEDVARAYLLAAESASAAGQWIPIGGGRLVSGAEAAAAAVKAAGSGRAGGGAPASNGGHPAPLDAAKAALGWAPAVSLDAGMRELVQWRRGSPDE